MDGGSCGGRAKRQRSKLRRRQGRESRPRCRIKGECFILWPPARRHPGRPTAANAAGGEMHPAPSVWCALAEGLTWAERPGLLPGFPVRHPGGIGTNTTRICSPGKFEQRRPGPRAPPSIPVRGDGGWMCGGWSLAPVQSRRAANRRAANHRKEYIQMEISREMFETANLWRHR